MPYYSIRLVVLFFSFILIVIAPAWGEEATHPPVETSEEILPKPVKTLILDKSLNRRLDPLIIKGDLLPRLHGLDIDNFRLFAHDGETFRVVPFQVDERTLRGEYVFTAGKLAGTDSDNGRFDYNDELVFMARDMGGQVPETHWGKMGDRGTEIVVTDPLDISRKGWVYFIHFPHTPPPLSEIDYINYSSENEIIQTAHYTMGYKKGFTYYTDLSYPEEAGGDGKDFFDRIKIRIKIKAFFNLVTINKTEEDFRAEIIGWKDGPIRVMRNVQNFFRIFFNMSSASTFSVSEYYDCFMYTPLRLTIPFNLKYVFNSFGISDWTWYFYGDFPGLKGGRAYSNRNRQGHYFNGEHDKKWVKKNIDQTNLVWGFITKEGVGTWFPCLILPELLYQNFGLFVLDDESVEDPPEDVPGVIGVGTEIKWAGVNQDLWFLLAKGTYELSIDTYFSKPGMQVEEVDEWLQIRNFPLSIDIVEKQENEILPMASAPQKNPQSTQKETASIVKKSGSRDRDTGFCALLTDNRERRFSLQQIHYHIGSSRVTPRTFILGQTISDKKFHRPEFKDIKRIDHHIEAIDPITRVKHPMFQKVTKYDDKSLDLLSCKPCGFSGRLPDEKEIFFWNTQINSVEFQECNDL